MPRLATLASRRWALPQLGIVLASLTLVVLAWVGADFAVRTQRSEEMRELRAEASNLAQGYAGQLRRELIAIGHVLNVLALERERDPAQFRLGMWENLLLEDPAAVWQTVVLDRQGRVAASSDPAQVGQDLSERVYFRALLTANSGRPYLGPPRRAHAGGPWVMDIARRLDDAAHGFDGAVIVVYRLDAVANHLRTGNLGRRDQAMVVGPGGVLSVVLAPLPQEPGSSVAGTPLAQAIAARRGAWLGPSPIDGRVRCFALAAIPGTDLTALAGIDMAEALAGSGGWRVGAYGFAALMTMLLLIMAAGLLRALREGQAREAMLTQDHAVLARANAELSAARAVADAKTAQLEGTIAGISDGISLLDRELRLVHWNDRFPEFSGVPREMLRVGLPMEEILRAQARAGEFGPQEDEAAVQREVAERIAALRAGSRVGVIERVRPDGRVLELRRAALPGGGFVTLYADITARKEVEVAHRRAREVAEAAAAEKSRFVAIVSHEIRTPLNVTLNALGLLEQSVLDPEQRRLTAMALQAGEALRGLLTDILDLSRMEVGQLTLRPAECALRPLLEAAIGMFQGSAAARGVLLELEIGPGVPDHIVTDAGRLRQIVMNLVSNAAKFAEPGPTILSAGTGVEDGRTMLRIALSDSGPPITAVQRQRLFRPFSQLEAGEAAGGAGLGLAICQVLATLLGGRIGCEPVEARGKAFWLTLPLAPAAAPRALPPRDPERSRRRQVRARVLLAEDVPANQAVIATMLRREGHSVVSVADGDAAVRLAASSPFDLVLMDVNMPVMDGLEATRRIRALPGPARTVPILALTANVSREDAEQCRAAGMEELIAKPVDRPVLAAAVLRHLAGAGRTGGATPAAAYAKGGEPGADPELDVQRIVRLRSELPAGLFGELAESCLGDVRARLPILRAAVGRQDCTAAEAAAHAMAGAAESYGLRRFGLRLRRVMAAARSGDAASVAVASADIEEAFAAAERALRGQLTPETV